MVDTTSTWGRFKDATAGEIAAYFRPAHVGGADHLGWILSMPAAEGAIYARGRSAGMWDANAGEACSAYERLAALIEAGATFPPCAAPSTPPGPCGPTVFPAATATPEPTEATMKITLNYNTSITFEIDPGDIADMLGPDASADEIAKACTDAIDDEAAQQFPGYTAQGKTDLVTEVTRKVAAIVTDDE